MSSKKWLIVFIITVLALAVVLVMFNFLTDPFGAFGDPLFKWWSYDMTNNPRVAKFSYLEENHDKYDSYIIGASNTSSFPTEELNKYFGANFYNLTMYGSDMLDAENYGKYLIENYKVKNLVLSVYIQNAEKYNDNSEPLTRCMHYKADKSSALEYYGRFLLINPRYGFDKITRYFTDGYMQSSYRVFDEATGAYDKSRRDIENIGDITDYLSQDSYAVFNNYPVTHGSIPYIRGCMESISRIKELCSQNGIRLTVICPPMYSEFMSGYSEEDILTFRRELAKVTEYWDFTVSSVSFEPRYFYDATHFRNGVGKMALAKIFNDTSVYVPSDFGTFVPFGCDTFPPYSHGSIGIDTEVPILMYHNITEVPTDGAVSVSAFEKQMSELKSSGYNAVTFDMLGDYVEKGAKLPENPIVITFDDGYKSNLSLASPVLEKYGMRATVFAIGVSVGKDTYKDTGEAMTEHLSLADMYEMQSSGIFDIQSHGYDIHEVEGRDIPPIRKGILKKPLETEARYIAFLRDDCKKEKESIGKNPTVLAYPYGLCDELSELILSEEGIISTVTTEPGMNTLVKGLSQSLRRLHRYDVTENTVISEIIKGIR